MTALHDRAATLARRLLDRLCGFLVYGPDDWHDR